MSFKKRAIAEGFGFMVDISEKKKKIRGKLKWGLVRKKDFGLAIFVLLSKIEGLF